MVLKNLHRTETVIGKPVEVGGFTFVPVIDVGVNLTLETGGAVMDTRISPNSMAVIRGEEVSVLPLTDMEKASKLMPEIIKKVQEK